MSLAKTFEVEVKIEGEESVDSVIRKLANIIGGEFKEKLFDGETGNLIPPPPRVSINGKLVQKPYNLVKVSNESEIILIPPTAGG
jgi:molybdopterin converting factor small subunit